MKHLYQLGGKNSFFLFTKYFFLTLCLFFLTGLKAQTANYDAATDWDPFPVDNFSITEEADADAVDGSAIKVSTLISTENWWEGLVQTFQNSTPAIVSGNEYTVTFRHKADTDRQVWAVIATRPTDTYGSDDTRYFEGFFDLSTEYQEFSYTFTATDADSGSVHVQLYAGGNDTAFYVDNFDITVVEGTTPPADEAYNTVADWDAFPTDNFEITEDADADALNGSAIKVSTLVSTQNWWEGLVQTFQNNTPAIVSGNEYTVTFRHKAETARQLWVIVAARPTDTYGSDDNKYFDGFVDLATGYQEYSYTFTAADTDSGSVHVQLYAGGDDTAFSIDDFDITVVEGTAPPAEEAYDTVADWDAFPVDNFAITEEADADAVNGSAIKVSTLVSTENWYDGLVQTFQNNTPAIVSGNEYTVTFSHKADADRQLWVVVAARPTDTYGSDDNKYFDGFIDLSTAYQEFSYTFTATDADSGSVHVQLYGGGDDTAFYVDDFDMTVVEGTTPPANDEAYDTVADWDAFPTDNFEITEEADADALNGSAIKVTTLVSTENWYDGLVQTFQNNTPAVINGNEYTVRFRHRAEADRQIWVTISGRPTDTYGSDDNSYFSEFINVGTGYQEYSFTFTSTDIVDGTVHVQLFGGGDDTAFYIDDFNITTGSDNPPLSGDEPWEVVERWNTYPTATLIHEIVADDNAVNQQAFRISVDPSTTLADSEWYDAGFQVLQDEGVVEEEGKRYQVSFRYRAESDRQVWFGLRSRPYNTFGTDDTDYFGNFLNATTNYQEFIRTITVASPDSIPSTIYTSFFMGGSDVPLFIDNIQIVEAEALRTVPTTLYVNPIGSDTNSGTANTAEGAFKTIGQALSSLIPGDTLLIADGLYQENSLALENIKGTPELVTTVKSINKWGAKIEGTSQYDELLAIVDSDYIVIDGLEVFNNNNVELEDWNAGIEATGSNHVTVRNVYAHDCGCNGVSGREGDYFTFENNVLRDNAKTNPYNCSGMSIYQPIALDDAPGFHIIIRNNVAFENECRLPFSPRGFTIPTDGNGIILDDFNHTQSEGIPAYTPSTLVENNLTFNNGGAGIKVYEVSNATIRNNTAWHNNYVLREFTGGLGDIGAQAVDGAIEIYNNVSVEEFGQENGHGLFVQTKGSATVAIKNNIVVGSRSFEGATPVEENNTFVSVNQQSFPAFANATTDVTFQDIQDFRNYFGIRELSPAIDAGDTDLGASKDFDGVDRPLGAATDIGAFEGATDSDEPLPADETLVSRIQNTETPLVIDGIKDGAYIGSKYDITKLSPTLDDPTDASDLSGVWTSLWDEDNLYLLVEVNDEAIQNDSSDSANDDSIEIHIDGENSRSETYENDDLIFVLSAGEEDSLEELLGNDTAGVTSQIVTTETGYTAEISIPWSTIGTVPSDSLKIGLDVQLNDDDDGGERDSKLAWQDLLEDNTTIPSRLGEGLIVVLPPPPAVVLAPSLITIDGVQDDSWAEVEGIAIGTEVSGEITDSNDLDGSWKSQWDENGLYFFISVTDDDLHNDSDQWYEDDGIEIYIDSDNSKNTTYGPDDHQLTIGWNNGNLIEDTKNNIGEGATVVVVDTDNGYDAEVSIPWSALSITPSAGQFIGLDIHLIDDDEGGPRSGKLSWYSQIDESFRDPSLFGDIFLAGDNTPPVDEMAYGEVGNTSGTDVWTSVGYENSYDDPVVVLGPMSNNGGQPGTLRVRSVEGNCFEWQVDEWYYLDGKHLMENVSYMIVESGTHTMANGHSIVAGKTNVNIDWVTVQLPNVFEDAPVIVPQVMTVNGNQPVDARVRNVTSKSFQVKLQEEENGGDGTGNREHFTETIGWVAMERRTSDGNGTAMFEIANTGNVVDHNGYNVNFEKSYTNDNRVLIGHDQTTNGGDAGTIRYRTNSYTANSVQIYFQEEASKDSETNHKTEKYGYAVFGKEGSLYKGTPVANSATTGTAESDGVIVYPNPTFNSARISIAGKRNVNGSVLVMDLSGNTVLQTSFSEFRNQIDVSKLPRGLYIVRIEAKGISKTVKLYKQ